VNVSITPTLILGVVLLAGSIIAYLVLFRAGAADKPVKTKIPLESLSRLWVDDYGPTEVLPPVSSRTLPQFSSKDISEFYRSTLAPYVETAMYSATIGPALDAIIKVLLILDQEGDCPSVVDAKGDPEQDDYGSYFDLLRKVSLRVHSLNVAQEAVTGLNNSGYKEPELILGRVLVVALAHDLGKIPKFRQGTGYALGSHPSVSVAVVDPLLTEVANKEEILKAIRDHHHTGSNNMLVQIIREADRRAREKEIAAMTGKAVVDSKMLGWLDPAEVLSEIEKAINVADASGAFEAFTDKDVVYVQPAFISRVIMDLATKNSVALNERTDFKALSATVVHTHFKILLAEDVPDGYAARMCSVKSNGKEKRMVLTPFRFDAFKTPLTELDKRKGSQVRSIESVRILPLKKTPSE